MRDKLDTANEREKTLDGTNLRGNVCSYEQTSKTKDDLQEEKLDGTNFTERILLLRTNEESYRRIIREKKLSVPIFKKND